ncbi:MAG: flagellar assembly protein T N-terminal domain-containing protein, partial [Desulfobacterales bacterium]|nr:flagellar assembly protein T N-terminal domain-containing protein [Desulfobacterales bacterium]
MPKSFYSKKDLIVNYLAKNKKWGWFSKTIMAAICILATMLALDTHRAYGQVEVKDIEAVGTAIIYKTDVEIAKQQAIENGLVSALDKAIAEILPVEVVAHNFQAINKIIYNDTDKYISDYKVLTEAVSDKSYRVLIQAKVSIKKLK